jgi:hypothetical protein
MKDSASAHNTVVAFYGEYSRYRYLYFTIGKQWSKDLLNSKGTTICQHTSIDRVRVKIMIGIKDNE